jgi:pimeloyl-ACP methyl ester carboxylesterase
MSPADLTITVAGSVGLHVRQWGERGTRPAFVLVHGLSSNARLWDAVAAELTSRGGVAYCVDLRSHGESDAPADGYDTVTAATDVAGVAARLGVRDAVVAGQSWGGNVVVRMAAEHPEVVGALGLIDGGWIDLANEFDSWDDCVAALTPPDIEGVPVADIRKLIRNGHLDWSDSAVEATLANLRIGPDGRVQRRLSIKHHMMIVRSMWNDPPWTYLPDIDVPVLLMPALPADPEQAERRRTRVTKAAAALSQARIREYVGADHDLHAQRPAEVAADLLGLAREL